MTMNARDLILSWIRKNGSRERWLLDLFHHLTDHGIPPDAAIDAMERFADEVIAIRALFFLTKNLDDN